MKKEILRSIFIRNICCDASAGFIQNYINTRNPALQASKRARLVAMYLYIAVAVRPSSYEHRVTPEVAVSFLPEVIAQI